MPVVVLNACQSGAVGKQIEAAVATRLLQEGTASVVAMGYTVYAAAAAEFMAAFYESVFAGSGITEAVGAGRRRLHQRPDRPSPKGPMALADWVVPVHYLRRDVQFPDLRVPRPAGVTFDTELDRLPDRRAVGIDEEDLESVGAFVGRDALFYDLEVATRLHRVVLLHGPGGTGKTELAKAFGRWWAATGGAEFPNWVIVHSFEPGVASFGLDGLLAAVGSRVLGVDFARLDTVERTAAVEQMLNGGRLLLILDNFETVAAMPDHTSATPPLDSAEREALRAFLQRRAAGGASAVIITSRSEELWLGAVRRIAVDGLNMSDAAEYAEHLLAPFPAVAARRARRAFAELLERLDGHPMAMRLVLPHLATAEPETLLAALAGVGDLPGVDGGNRKTSLAASVAYSFEHLPSATRRLLVVLCLLHGVADIAVLAVFSTLPEVPDRFWGATSERWGEALESAAAVGLLTRLGDGLYRLHPALPAFLAAKWRDDERIEYDDQRQVAVRALLDVYAAVGQWLRSEIRSGDAEFAYTVIGGQRRTLGALLAVALDIGRWELAQDILVALDEYWNSHGLYEEARGWGERARLAVETSDGSPPPPDDPAGAFWLFLAESRAIRQVGAGQLDHAEATFREILDIAQAEPVTPEKLERLAVSYHGLGVVALDRGRLDEAEDWYCQSLVITEELGNGLSMADTYYQLGIVAHRRGCLDKAEDWYRQSILINEELSNRPGMASAYQAVGAVALDRGRLDEAVDWYRRSLTIDEELGNRPGMAGAYQAFGGVALNRGRFDEAVDWYRRSLAIDGELGDRRSMAACCHQLGFVAHRRGRFDEAEGWYRRSLIINEELRDRLGVALSYRQLAGVAAEHWDRLGEADAWNRRSLAIDKELGNGRGVAVCYQQLGVVAHRRGRLDEAEGWYRQSLIIIEELGNGRDMAVNYHQLGGLAQDLGRFDEAEDWYRRSLAINEQLDNLEGMAFTFGQLGLLREERGFLEEALELVVLCFVSYDRLPDAAGVPTLADLARLTATLGSDALESCWTRVAGRPLPRVVREFVESQPVGPGERDE